MSKPQIWLVQLKEGFKVQLKEGFWVSWIKTYSNWSQIPVYDCKLVQNYNLFCSSITLMCSVIIDHFILCSELSALSFKFKKGLNVFIYYLLISTVGGEWLLWMIPPVFLFSKNYLWSIFLGHLLLLRVGGFLSTIRTIALWLPSRSNLSIVSRHYFKNNIRIN